MTHNYQEFASS